MMMVSTGFLLHNDDINADRLRSCSDGRANAMGGRQQDGVEGCGEPLRRCAADWGAGEENIGTGLLFWSWLHPTVMFGRCK